MLVIDCAYSPNGGGNSLNNNKLHDVMLLTGGSVAALYVTCFISRMLEGRRLGHLIAACGKDSFYIMGFQFFGFKVGTLILSLFGIDRSLAALSAPAGDYFLLFLYYLIMGFVFPVALMWLLRALKGLIIKDKQI